MSVSPRRPGPEDAKTPDGVDLLERAAHELGNQLAAIRLSAHLLGREARGRAVADAAAIERVAAHSGALLGLMRLLLSSGGLRVRIAPAEVLAKLARALEPAGKGAAELRVLSAGELPDVECDADALHQVLAVLVYASIEASAPKGRVHVSVDRGGRGVAFTVEDDAAAHELDGRRGRELGGRALGVELADAVLRRHGARVNVAATAPCTRVEVRVPASRRRRPPG